MEPQGCALTALRRATTTDSGYAAPLPRPLAALDWNGSSHHRPRAKKEAAIDAFPAPIMGLKVTGLAICLRAVSSPISVACAFRFLAAD
jgi:hypothetical protein